MNILIVGNGFDLSHYLPTKYDHFMVAMNAIEKWDIANGEMSFDDLFRSLYEKEDYFFGYTKAMYKTDEIKISVEQATKLKKQLEENVWYQYFSDHVREVKTWIDFEQEIEQVLIIVARCINDIEKFNNLDDVYQYFDNTSNEGLKIREKDQKILSYFKFFSYEFYEAKELNNLYPKSNYGENIGNTRPNVNLEYCYGKNLSHGLNPSLFLDYLMMDLDNFIELFNLYLVSIIEKLKLKLELKITKNTWIQPNKIFSFNYTNTYQNFYDFVEVDFLHGSTGDFQNIVLGISDLHNEVLKKLKAYGFTKYHQKLLKDTDYKFLSENWHAISLKSFWQSVKNGRAITLEQKEINQMNIYIWGHSLDTSDETYINEIFSFNTEFDEQVRVTVYYFNKAAKFSLLNNLLAILEKDKVEKWMKKGWLKFELNPNVVELNNIKPVELPKIETA